MPLKFELENDEENECFRIVCETQHQPDPAADGDRQRAAHAPEFHELRVLRQAFEDLGEAPFTLSVNGEREDLPRLEQLIDHVERLGRQGAADSALQGPR